jgi:hypothetical protein
MMLIQNMGLKVECFSLLETTLIQISEPAKMTVCPMPVMIHSPAQEL